ncbi:MAG: hypothetical protein SFY80_15340 [Verrucomicrobiota bacterium]|nr:hypothetical protein [Verrucomicrobiota bacterium]
MSYQDKSYSPQLHMRRPDLENLPPLKLPAGFTIRNHRDGEFTHWTAIINDSFGGERTEHDFQNSMGTDSAHHRDRIFYVFDDKEQPCATASAYGHAPLGYVHYVGTRPKFAGKRLGYWVSLAVLYKFKELGYTNAELDSDDFRIPALKIYLDLGFLPVIVHPNQEDRWRDVAAALKNPKILDAWEYRLPTDATP